MSTERLRAEHAALLAFWEYWNSQAGHFDASNIGLCTAFDTEDAHALEALSDKVFEAMGRQP